jgi:hypothetical protein
MLLVRFFLLGRGEGFEILLNASFDDLSGFVVVIDHAYRGFGVLERLVDLEEMRNLLKNVLREGRDVPISGVDRIP